MAGFIFLAFLVFVIVFIVYVVKKGRRNKRSACKKCKATYTANDIDIRASDLKFRKKKHEETVGNVKFTRWETIFYRDVLCTCTCSKCGTSDLFIKSIDVYSSDDTYSQNTAEEYAHLKDKVRNLFNKEVFQDKEFSIVHSDFEDFN